MSRTKLITKEAASAVETKAVETSAENSSVEQPTEKAAEVKLPETLKRTGKIAKVPYSLTYPNPAVAVITEAQKVEALKNYFHLRAGVVLSECVRRENPVIEDFRKEAQAIESAILDFKPELSGAELAAHVLRIGIKNNPQFRLAPISDFTASLADILKEEPTTEGGDLDKSESESEEETQETSA